MGFGWVEITSFSHRIYWAISDNWAPHPRFGRDPAALVWRAVPATHCSVVYRVVMMIRRIVSIGILCLLLVSCVVPSSSDQFWWNWWVSTAVAVATFLAVLAALGGPLLVEFLRSKWFPPLLRLTLLSDAGQIGENRYPLQDGSVRSEARRYYHVQVSNGRRLLSPAEDVQVFLSRVDELGPDGSWQVTWAGEIPMKWQNQQISPLTRTIGHDYPCDLCGVGSEQGLSSELLIFPFTLNALRQQQCNLVVSLQAKGIRADSPICRFEIAWYGKWESGETEMKRHLVIKQLGTPIQA